MHVDQNKTCLNCELECVEKCKVIHSFLDSTGYYWRLIEGFSKIVSPLTRLLIKETRFVWDNQCQTSFDKMKVMLTEASVLTQPESGRKRLYGI